MVMLILGVLFLGVGRVLDSVFRFRMSRVGQRRHFFKAGHSITVAITKCERSMVGQRGQPT
jgi:hypothetical protein